MKILVKGTDWFVPTNKGAKYIGTNYSPDETVRFLKSKGLKILTKDNAIYNLVEKLNCEVEKINKSAYESWLEDMEYLQNCGYSIIGNFFENPEEYYFVYEYIGENNIQYLYWID